MTREPVRATAPANQLPFPLNVRLVMYGWNLLFLKPGPYQPDPAHDEAWNRGAYLAEGLGHCGACHTPRNVLGAEKASEKFAGGEAEGWSAYAINASSPAPVPWTADTLLQYLSHGFNADHGVARGPMLDVASNLGAAPGDDLHAIATYVAAQIGDAGRAHAASGETSRDAKRARQDGRGGERRQPGRHVAEPRSECRQ